LQAMNVQRNKERDMLLMWIVDRSRTWHLVLGEAEVVGLLLKLSLLYYQYCSGLSTPYLEVFAADTFLECTFPH